MVNFLCCGNSNRCCRSSCLCSNRCYGCQQRTLVGTIPVPPPTPISTASGIMVANEGTQTVASGGLVNLGGIVSSVGSGITYTSPNLITLSPGTYYISFSAIVDNTDTAGQAGVTIQENGASVPSTARYLEGTAVGGEVSTQLLLTVSNTTQISVANLSTVSNDYSATSLVVTKLS